MNRRNINREKILERDDYVCVYCLGEATEVDHVVPWSYSQCDDEDNLVAACSICNSIASDLVFKSFDEKSLYIRTIRSGKKWTKKLKKVTPPICIDCGKIFKQCFDGSTLFMCSECIEKMEKSKRICIYEDRKYFMKFLEY